MLTLRRPQGLCNRHSEHAATFAAARRISAAGAADGGLANATALAAAALPRLCSHPCLLPLSHFPAAPRHSCTYTSPLLLSLPARQLRGLGFRYRLQVRRGPLRTLAHTPVQTCPA
jgi:hypothetical protein